MKDQLITKRKSLILKCIAVSLMVILHTFGFPDRISNQTYISLWSLNGSPIEMMVANFGSICVGMFLFLSGYGLYQTYNTNVNYKGILNRILKLYKNYWCVFLIFIPLGFFMRIYKFNLITIILNFFALSSSYNAEWWFLRLYIMLILLYPLLLKILIKHSTKKVLIGSFIINILGLVGTKLSYIVGINNLLVELINILLGGQFLFILGISISKNAYFDLMVSKLKWKLAWHWIIFLMFTPIMGVILAIPVIGEIMKLILIPIFIFLIANMISKNSIMEFIGKHSTNIWLTHSFFCYYLFPKLTFYPKYSILIFIWILVISIASSYIINGILAFCKNFKKYSKSLTIRKKYTS